VQAVQALKAEFPLAVLLAVAGLARATFFYHQARLARPAARAALDAALDDAIRTAVTQAKGRYGHRRIHRELGKDGWRVAKKTVLARMRTLGLTCQVRRRKRGTSARGERGTTAPNLLNRDFTASAPNQRWVTDVTELRIGDDKRYLAPVMDLFDRQIIAYTLGRAPNLEVATSALQAALATLGPAEQPLVHTDQGFQYQHRAWRALLAQAGATPSMSRKGNCLDNAVIESFFGHLKAEVLLERFPSIEALETAVHAYIHWYNHERTSEPLKGLSPVQYRAHAHLT
jgi:putative transposase